MLLILHAPAGGVFNAIGSFPVTEFLQADIFWLNILLLCIEISRALLADPFCPFEEMHIGREKVERMSGPIVEALLEARS